MLNAEYKFGKVNELPVAIEKGQAGVCFKNIFQNNNGGVSLIMLEAGQNIAEHLAPAEVMVYVVEGEIELTMNKLPNVVKAGKFFLMGQGVAHSLVAMADSRVLLVKVKA